MQRLFKKNDMKPIYLFLVAAFLWTGCEEDDITPDTPEYVMAGGETTTLSTGPDAFTFPSANLDAAGLTRHLEADAAFGQQFVSAPAERFGGVGPVFNQNSCESCHVRNGRGIVPQYEHDPNTSLLLRISMPGAGDYGRIVPVPGFGGQLQHKAIFGTQPEGKVSKTDIEAIVSYLDGNQVVLKRPVYTVVDTYMPWPSEALISPRVAQPVHGVGLLEAIPESSLLALADEADSNGDGISGRPNYVWDVLAQQLAVGRFGWKAEQPTASQQAADAAHNDMGLTSFYFPTESCDGQTNCTEGRQDELDVDAQTIDLFTFYFQTLAVPAVRNYSSPAFQRGRELFEQAKCSSCHVPRHVTGDHPIAALSNQVIYPYTDLLLHDMGDRLADNRPTYSANGREWRTAPLWGIGLTQVINPKATFLHDGRAQTLEEAILWHGGEAEASSTYFKALSRAEREAVVAFLNGL